MYSDNGNDSHPHRCKIGTDLRAANQTTRMVQRETVSQRGCAAQAVHAVCRGAFAENHFTDPFFVARMQLTKKSTTMKIRCFASNMTNHLEHDQHPS